MKFTVKVGAVDPLEAEIVVEAASEEEAEEKALELARLGRGIEWSVNARENYQVLEVLE